MIENIKSLLTKQEWIRLPLLLMLMLISVLMEALGVGMVFPLVSLLMGGESSIQNESLLRLIDSFGPIFEGKLIIALMFLFIFIYALKNIYLVYFSWWQINFTMNIKVRLSKDLMSLYMAQPYSFHLERNSAHLIRNLLSETSMFTGRVITPIIILISELLIVLALVSMMLYIEPVGTIIVGATIGISAGLFYLFSHNKMTHWGEVRQKEEGSRLQHLQQGLGSIKELILSGHENNMLQRFSLSDKKVGNTLKFQHVIHSIPRFLLEFIVVASIAIIVISMMMINKTYQEIIPTLAFFGAASIRIVPSASRMLGSINSLRYSAPALDVLIREFNLSQYSRTNYSQSQNISFKNKICLRGVSFSYDNSSNKVLENINLTIKKGQFVGIIGASGAGKSTLLDLILGLHQPSNGQILVDDINIKNNISAWQKNIGYVSQNVFLTDDSLVNNIALGVDKDKINHNQIDRVLERVHLSDFCNNLSNGKETLLGENGVRISGGQKQRIGIARALYRNPEVLILDEATSALDITTENSILDDIEMLKGSITAIIVSHKKSTVRACDFIFEIDKH